MPLYEYRCPCGTILDQRRSVEERDEPIRCPHCFEPMNRAMGTPSIVFKGSGFYATSHGK